MADLQMVLRNGVRSAHAGPAYEYATSYAQDSTTNVFSSISSDLSSSGGKEYLTCSISPKRANSLLEIDICVPNLTASAGMNIFVALFKDSETTSRKIVAATPYTAAYFASASLKFILPSTGSTSSQTWKMRFGSNNAGTVYVANRSGANEFGNSDLTTFRIREIFVP